MVSGQDNTGTGDPRLDAIAMAAQQALLFGEFSAQAAGAEHFEDPVMHTYFLHYIFGALESISQHATLPVQLQEEDKVNAMGHALMTFEGSSRQDVLGTLKMLVRATDDAAVNIREEGRKAALAWNLGEDASAASRFSELMENPDNFPRKVDPSPPPGPKPDQH
ncbi:MAG: hypothetical protein WBN31_03115 [Gammaproteobacteria bacterium]